MRFVGSPMIARDTKRQRLYDTEKKHSLWAKGDRAMSLSDINKMVQRIVRSKRFSKEFGDLNSRKSGVTVTDGRGRRSGAASWSTNEIAMPRFARHKLYTLHEVAHLAAANQEREEVGPLSEAPHGPRFRRAYLTLVKWECGKEAYEEMRRLFAVAGLDLSLNAAA